MAGTVMREKVRRRKISCTHDIKTQGETTVGEFICNRMFVYELKQPTLKSVVELRIAANHVTKHTDVSAEMTSIIAQFIL